VVPTAVITRTLRYVRQLEGETRSAVRSLAEVIDHRDPHTAHHSERVATYAVALARRLNLDEDQVELIDQAASVHDLGKIGVADSVLLKPGPLTEGERASMWLHTEIGARILNHYELFRDGAQIVLHHHERWDGDGYPGGLAGVAIPLGSRVVAVADAFDAMTSNRPYRTALSVAEAVRRLREGAAMQWDPDIVDVFVRLLAEGGIGPSVAPDAVTPASAAGSAPTVDAFPEVER
jgi:polar amino acid transport system substrate-binding protein